MSKLFYIIGASGAGKDTLMNYARIKINGAEQLLFAHRYITRPPFAGSENHVYLSEEEFKARIKNNLFAMHWESHGQYYGIGIEINSWMKKGFNVIVNGSRQYLQAAQQLYPHLTAILITASPEVLVGRLSSRGRETLGEVQKRITRSGEINADLENCIRISNDHVIEEAGNKLVDIISLKPKHYI